MIKRTVKSQRIPAVPFTVSPELRAFLAPMKKQLDIIQGEADLFDKTITFRDLRYLYPQGVSQGFTSFDWSKVDGSGKPDDNADVTSENTALNTTSVSSILASSVAGWAHSSDETKIDGGVLKTGTVLADSIYTLSLSALSAILGDVFSGSITGTIITGGTFQTAVSGKRIIINSDGMSLHVTSSVDQYGEFKYGDGTKYGAGALAYIHHSASLVPFYIAAEQTVADFHYYNRSSDPTGAAEVGDTCVVSGVLKICTGAGTPGTWGAV